jgi:hypothetical protein
MNTPNKSLPGKDIMTDQIETDRVDCYAGSRADEYPLRFVHNGHHVEVNRIIKRWQTPDSRCFKVSGDDGIYYTLTYDHLADKWEITSGNKQKGST